MGEGSGCSPLLSPTRGSSRPREVRLPSHRDVRFAGGYVLILRGLEECGRREVLLRVRSAPRLGFAAD